MRRSLVGSKRWLCAAASAVAVLWCSPASAGARFGTECQSDYQNNYQITLPEVWNRCSWFNNALGDLDTLVYYYNLHGAKPWWEDSLDQYELDRDDLVSANSQGAACGSSY